MHLLVTMSQQTLSELVSLQSRLDPAAETLAHYQSLPVAHHQLEEATYQSGALGVDDVVGWAASLDPPPPRNVIHIDVRSPTRNSYFGGRAWSTTLCRELRRQLPSLKILHLTPQPATIDQLLNSMRTNPPGKPKDAHVGLYPTTNLVYTPPNCDRQGTALEIKRVDDNIRQAASPRARLGNAAPGNGKARKRS